MNLSNGHTNDLASRGMSICIAAILRGEQSFVEEWIAYHRLIGVDHFLLYDDDLNQPLKRLTESHAPYVTTIDWSTCHFNQPGRNKQTKAYTHALNYKKHDWLAFIDGDEFIVLRRHTSLRDFLQFDSRVGAVCLRWHVFGHNGFYEDPPGLIINSLTKRKRSPEHQKKWIVRPTAVSFVRSPHSYGLRAGYIGVGADGNPSCPLASPDETEIAHINHYICRSFKTWMARVTRGDPARDEYVRNGRNSWKLDHELCLRKFVETSALFNEYEDRFLCNFGDRIVTYLEELNRKKT